MHTLATFSILAIFDIHNLRRVFVLCIIECGKDLDVNLALSTDTLDTSYEPLLQHVAGIGDLPRVDLFRIIDNYQASRFGGTRKEVDEIHNAIFTQIARLQNVVRGQVLLFRGQVGVSRRRNAKVAALILVEDAREYRG